MKIIEILQKVANGEIEKGTKFILGDNLYVFNGDRFKAGNFYLGGRIFLNARDLNQEVDLIEPKKFLVKFNIRGLQERFTYLNYDEISGYVHLQDKYGAPSIQTEFTEQELQSIKPVKEFLDDMQGKYKLVEVTNDEDY